MKQILNLKHQKSLFFWKNVFYEHGDKNGKQLARALKEATTANHIHAICNKAGILEHNSGKIAEIFHDFYSKLYKLPPQHKPPHLTLLKEDMIQKFLEDSKIPSLSPEDMNSLEDPITILELQASIKDLKTGKSPWPRWIYITILQNLHTTPF